MLIDNYPIIFSLNTNFDSICINSFYLKRFYLNSKFDEPNKF